ncbi:MAG TPA: hypothetical protein VN764_05140 [Polyangiaceae bacterium]|nr:hypothetical protein [Polyangiaceae bacterium]
MEAVIDPTRDQAEDSEGSRSSSGAATPRDKKRSWSSYLGVLGVGIAAGCGIGYVGHHLQVNAAPQDACKQWEGAICRGVGEETYACKQAKTASALLLSGPACAQAQPGLQTKVQQIKAGRGPCTELSDRLCQELGPDGQGCELVKSKEPTLSVKDCEDMAKNYDQVLGQLMSRQTRGTLPKANSTPVVP